MRSTKDGNFFQCDSSVVQYLKEIRGRPFSKAEAYLSFSKDVNCQKDWSISGYSAMWGWSRNKVRRFVDQLLSEKGQATDRHGTPYGHPIHLIVGNNSKRKDRLRTGYGQATDTTIKNKNKNKKTTLLIYPERFDFFWEDYPRKVAKANALKAWEKNDCGNGLYEEVMAGLKRQLPFWKEKEKKFIPYPATWINGHRWNDEVDNITKVELWR